MNVQRTSADSPETPADPPAFDVTAILLAQHRDYTEVQNLREDPSDSTRVLYEWRDGTPVCTRKDAIVSYKGARPGSPSTRLPLDRAALAEHFPDTSPQDAIDRMISQTNTPQPDAQPAPLSTAPDGDQ